MKACPKCGARYTEDLSFCLSDGTPLTPAPDSAEEITLVRPDIPGTSAAVTPSSSAVKYIAITLGVLLTLALVITAAVIGALWLYRSDTPANSRAETNLPAAATPRPSVAPANTPDVDLKQREAELERERKALADERKRLEDEKKRQGDDKPAADASPFTDPGTARITFGRGSVGQTVRGRIARARSYVLRTLPGQYLTAGVTSAGGCVVFDGGSATTAFTTSSGDTALALRNNCDEPVNFSLRVTVR